MVTVSNRKLVLFSFAMICCVLLSFKLSLDCGRVKKRTPLHWSGKPATREMASFYAHGEHVSTPTDTFFTKERRTNTSNIYDGAKAEILTRDTLFNAFYPSTDQDDKINEAERPKAATDAIDGGFNSFTDPKTDRIDAERRTKAGTDMIDEKVNASNPSTDPDKINEERIATIEKACGNLTLWSQEIYRHYNFRYMHSKQFRFATCKVPKSGSTFWVQAHVLLQYGAAYGRSVLTMDRSTIHELSSKWAIAFRSLRLDPSSKVVISSRNPYTRLFSAYVDKIFLPLMFEVSRKFVQGDEFTPSDRCKRDPTFQEFLDGVLQQALSGRILNRHWSPIHSLCDPCALRPSFVVKQESFSRDAEYVFNSLGVSRDEYHFLLEHRVQTSVSNIVKTFYDVVGHSQLTLQCIGWNGALQRLWASLQIQGYIRNTTKCPAELCEEDVGYYKGPNFLTNIIIKEILADPLGPDGSLSQRRAALLAAYRDVTSATIGRIQKVFQQDFQLFDYSLDPPS